MKPALLSFTITLALISSGCEDSQGPSASASERNTDTITEPSDFTFYVSDTVSSDLQSEYSVFTVDCISGSSSGLIALLDGSTATVTVIDSSGIGISAGGLGSGPGEYQQPRAISVADDGSVAVSDFMGGFIRILEPGLETFYDIDGFLMANPGKMVLLNSGDITGMRILFTSEDGETSIGHQTCLWTDAASDPAVIYNQDMHTFSLNDFGWSLIAPYPMTGSPDGVVYTGEVSIDVYELTSYAPDGTELWSVVRPFLRTEKTPEEIQVEEEIVTRLMQQSEHQADYTPEPINYAVTDLALGPEGNLWARRPGAGGIFFDVLDASSGDFLFSVSTDIDYPLLAVTPARILAVIPGETQSLVELDIEPTQSSAE